MVRRDGSPLTAAHLDWLGRRLRAHHQLYTALRHRLQAKTRDYPQLIGALRRMESAATAAREAVDRERVAMKEAAELTRVDDRRPY